MKTRLSNLVAAALAFSVSSAEAAPVEVTYTVTGTSGNWYLNFTVSNNVDSEYIISNFGVSADSRTWYESAPTYWQAWTSIAGFNYSGQRFIFEINWTTGSSNSYSDKIDNGESLGGFVVHSTSVDMPASWYWYTNGRSPTSYSGPGNYLYSNPSIPTKLTFIGEASLSTGGNPNTPANPSIPEPDSIFLVNLGLVSLFICSRRKASFRQ
jgi:hypothetical protein